MRVVAFDASGSTAHFVGKMVLDAQKRSTDQRDLMVYFTGSHVSRPIHLYQGRSDEFIPAGPDGILAVLEWMESRHLQPTDELIIYHDGYFLDTEQVISIIEKSWFTVKFRLFGGSINTGLIPLLEKSGIETIVVPV